ncbi:MAG TPA: hypothetical protein VJ719_08605 [Chthoniobacterales bacterium]|nr:hypothetical protein [Chthoniobacterales bacterium]
MDATDWGPQLRFSAPRKLINEFFDEVGSKLPPFLLYGSGDFHHLTGLCLRRVQGPIVLVSFDNHPDWDVRPPKWGCGGWVNRALELSQVQKVSVWGCGNFECWWPRQIFGNRRAERSGRLELHAWANGRAAGDKSRRGAILPTNWQDHFLEFLRVVKGHRVYVTIDLDCLVASEAVTNWENGRFTSADLKWALERLHQQCQIVAGDICGGFSKPRYARWKQRFASEIDHPKMARPSEDQIRDTNFHTLGKIWPWLIG